MYINDVLVRWICCRLKSADVSSGERPYRIEGRFDMMQGAKMNVVLVRKIG